MQKIIWQPVSIDTLSYEFGIIVNRDFVKQTLDLNIGSEMQRNMTRLGRDILKRYRQDSGTPFIFDGETYFVRQFDIGRDGKWLALEGCYGKNPLETQEGPVKYFSHNCDYSSDVHTLMSLVDQWVNYFETVKKAIK